MRIVYTFRKSNLQNNKYRDNFEKLFLDLH